MLHTSSCHRRYLTCWEGHSNKMMSNPGHLSPCLQSSWVLCIHIDAPARGRTTSPQRRLEGFKMIGMHLLGGQRRCGGGMLWRRGLIFWTLGTALMPLRPFVLEPHCDAFGSRLLGPPPLACPQGCAPPLKQETPLTPRPIGQERQIARVLDDLAQETPGVFQQRACLASPWHLPQKTGRALHQHARPSW